MTQWNRPRSCLLAFALVWSAISVAADGDRPSLSTGALVFGDAYYVPSFHNDEGDDAAGLVMRRAYLTFDADFRAWFGRLRFEANQSGAFETYDLDVKAKDLYLGRNFGAQKVSVGLSPTPTFDTIEDVWGLRYLARTPMDLQGVASRDTGLALAGPLSADGRFSYRALFAPTVEFGSDSSDARTFMTAVTWRPDDGWMVDVYADYQEFPGATDRRTLQGFVGFETDDLRFGLQYSNQDREDDPPLELASGFLVSRLSGRSSLVLRVDHLFEPSPKGDDIDYLPFDPSARATMVIAGLEFRFGEHFALTPNVVFKGYGHDDTGERPDADVHLRLTLFVDFE